VRRSALFTAALAGAAVLASGLTADSARAQDGALPDMGSSANELLSPQEESKYGAYMLYELRRRGYVLDDPLLDDWLDGMGHRLAAASDRPEQDFSFFMMRDRQINAFATLGGYVGVNAGLVLTAEAEDEVAGVLAHEISHVTQKHMLRAVERAKQDRLPIMLATLGVILAAQQGGKDGGRRGNGDAVQAAVIGGQALAVQRQIDYTRSSESEADRIGIQTLYRAGYDPEGIADFFERMDRATRGNAGGYQVPDFLQTHPVTTTRLSEARDRARRLSQQPRQITDAGGVSLNPLLPVGLSTAGGRSVPVPTRMFAWARERLRVLSSDTPAAAQKELQALVAAAGSKATDAQRYGLALAKIQAGHPAESEADLQALAKRNPDNLWIDIALAEAAHSAKNELLARERYEALLRRHPGERSVGLSYAAALNAIGTPEAGRRAQSVLRPLLASSAYDPVFQKNLGRASELAGDLPRAGEAYAEAAYLNGRAEDALNQLAALLKRGDLQYVQRARIEARIAAITPDALEMRRQGLKPEDQPSDRS